MYTSRDSSTTSLLAAPSGTTGCSPAACALSGLGFRGSGLGCGAEFFFWGGEGFGFGASCFVFRVSGFGLRVEG